jgi:hypothetical protein
MPKTIWDSTLYYKTPSLKKCEMFIKGNIEVKDIKEILNEFELRISTLFDFKFPNDIHMWKLFVIQTYLKPILSNFFYMSIDATKGGGKTTLLEIMSFISRHGFLGGDVSASALPRMVEELDLSLFLDEIDQRIGKGEEDSINILRKGQRRGNVYTRLNKNTFIPETFDVAGAHSYSHRTELEDAFVSRSIPTHTAETKDSMLPIINIFKESILMDLKDQLFFWSFKNLPSFAKLLQEVTTSLSSVVVSVVGCSSSFQETDILSLRKGLFDEITKNFSENELSLINSLKGRNAELGFLILHISRLLDLDLSPFIKIVMEDKKESEEYSSEY